MVYLTPLNGLYFCRERALWQFDIDSTWTDLLYFQAVDLELGCREIGDLERNLDEC